MTGAWLEEGLLQGPAGRWQKPEKEADGWTRRDNKIKMWWRSSGSVEANHYYLMGPWLSQSESALQEYSVCNKLSLPVHIKTLCYFDHITFLECGRQIQLTLEKRPGHSWFGTILEIFRTVKLTFQIKIQWHGWIPHQCPRAVCGCGGHHSLDPMQSKLLKTTNSSYFITRMKVFFFITISCWYFFPSVQITDLMSPSSLMLVCWLSPTVYPIPGTCFK